MGENYQDHNCAYANSTGAIWTLSVFTQFFLRFIAPRVRTLYWGQAQGLHILGPKLLLPMGCVKLGEKNCIHLPSVGEQTGINYPISRNQWEVIILGPVHNSTLHFYVQRTERTELSLHVSLRYVVRFEHEFLFA